jgi:transcriptional regulator with XRE-family HTH domain
MKPHEQAKAWRVKRKLTLDQLAELTGYSVPAIRKFEAGSRNKQAGEKHSEWTIQRYRMACAGAEAQLRTGKEFAW